MNDEGLSDSKGKIRKSASRRRRAEPPKTAIIAPDIQMKVSKQSKELDELSRQSEFEERVLKASKGLKALSEKSEAIEKMLKQSEDLKALSKRSLGIKTTIQSGLAANLQFSPTKDISGIHALTKTYNEILKDGLLKSLSPLSTHWNVEPSVASKEVIRFEGKLRAERQSVEKLVQEISRSKKANGDKVRRLTTELETLRKTQELAFFLDSVSSEARNFILKNDGFQKNFVGNKEANAFVVSADIRRSTELMLKARTPQLFSEFMTEVCQALVEIYKSNYGIIDKFTGDGILVFFPEFFSGEDAGYFALKSSFEAREVFVELYKKHRSSFTCVLKDVGLGIGMDVGLVSLLRMAGTLTVVGQPVVYACRLGGAPAGNIYLNQGAYDVVSKQYGQCFELRETELLVKHEGAMLCYSANVRDLSMIPGKPAWCSSPT